MAANPRPDSSVSSPSTWVGGLLPLGALACGLGLPGWAAAQTEAAAEAVALPKITVTAPALPEQGKDSVQAVRTRIGRGEQALRDIPQSVTVVTERLIDDRNLDTFKDTLKNTAGITFLAAEGGEEDIRLRGFSLQATGDIFIDGMRDPAFYDRDSFNWDRLELLRGSASMLFGRGSTGGAANQVSKQPFLMDGHEVNLTLGSHRHRRLTGDFNIKTGDDAALRINAMATQADNNGAGSAIDKQGIAGTYRWGIGTSDEFSLGLFHLNNQNGINYGLPWIRPTASAPASSAGMITTLDPSAYYGMASDQSHGSASTATLAHTHRFDADASLKTTVRRGAFKRDQRASTVRLCTQTTNATTGVVTNPQCPTTQVALDTLSDATILTRGAQLKIQDLDTLHAQSDLSARFDALGLRHEVQAGADWAREEKIVYRATTPTGVNLAKPTTTIGTPDDGASIDEGQRVLSKASGFVNQAWGVYAQDLLTVAPGWKLLGGLRYDRMDGQFEQIATTGVVTPYRQQIGEFSQRLGALWQPSPTQSYHASWGSSFNTSGDSYSYNAQSANTDPEQSVNIELGAKLDSDDRLFSTRVALFHSVKKNERNTDPDTAATALLLSGKRHASGVDIDFTGMLTRQWEVYVSYMWIPDARVDVAAPTAATFGNRQGDRPGLTPRHSGTVWNTFQLSPKWRVGGGLNFRSESTPADQQAANAVTSPGYVTGDLMAEYAFDPQRFIVKANLSNVTNKLYGEGLYRGHYIPGAGRVLAVTGTLKF
ncbi:TonB-dependent receptor [Leptothrix cholodnii SP-6]|uniref:TonB-dependent receptor n=1 Tax=Leptothrix cholodnii (strain ATCC 51168 / LMG 8142 / SP-6) TaxID=395495 RepID=B1XWG8_LEPCP|nr:TonB-dependent receptor [Leptothrix cholodnii]ACB33836.1 TonB-dependent receptor [Leptothrix cholodnii SP-6]